MANSYVIGDIHGALKALDQVLNRAPLVRGDTLIFLGDYVDGWSESAQVVERLMSLENDFQCIFMMGNHDTWCAAWLTGDEKPERWLRFGGVSTLSSYKFARKHIAEHKSFFEELKTYYIDENNRLFVHAGFTSVKGIEKEYDPTVCYWDRTLWEMALTLAHTDLKPQSDQFPKRLLHYDEIYIGHSPTIRAGSDKPMNIHNLWNVDTGAAFTGPLTIMNIETKEFWQSEPVNKLYPHEKGRN